MELGAHTHGERGGVMRLLGWVETRMFELMRFQREEMQLQVLPR